MDHRAEAERLLATLKDAVPATSQEGAEASLQATVALAHAVLHLAAEVRHGLRDVVYEMRS